MTWLDEARSRCDEAAGRTLRGSIGQRYDAAIATVAAEVRELQAGRTKQRYVLRCTSENIGGVTVIVGMVEQDAGPGR